MGSLLPRIDEVLARAERSRKDLEETLAIVEDDAECMRGNNRWQRRLMSIIDGPQPAREAEDESDGEEGELQWRRALSSILRRLRESRATRAAREAAEERMDLTLSDEEKGESMLAVE